MCRTASKLLALWWGDYSLPYITCICCICSKYLSQQLENTCVNVYMYVCVWTLHKCGIHTNMHTFSLSYKKGPSVIFSNMALSLKGIILDKIIQESKDKCCRISWMRYLNKLISQKQTREQQLESCSSRMEIFILKITLKDLIHHCNCSQWHTVFLKNAYRSFLMTKMKIT